MRLMAHFVDLERDAPEPPPLRAEDLPRPSPSRRRRRRPRRSGSCSPAACGCRSAPCARRRSCWPTPAASRPPAWPPTTPSGPRWCSSPTPSGPAHRCGCERSLRRRLDVLRAPIDATKAAAKALGGTLNTAFVTVAAAAAGRYHAQLGAPDRAPAGVDGDQHPHPGLRGQRLHAGPPARADRRDADGRALRPHRRGRRARPGRVGHRQPRHAGRRWPPRCRSSLVTRIARQQTQTVDFATSNVRAAPFAVYIAGAQVAGELPDRAARRGRVQPHADVLRRQPRHRAAHRRGGGRPNRICCAS